MDLNTFIHLVGEMGSTATVAFMVFYLFNRTLPGLSNSISSLAERHSSAIDRLIDHHAQLSTDLIAAHKSELAAERVQCHEDHGKIIAKLDLNHEQVMREIWGQRKTGKS